MNDITVLFLGPEGTYSHQAALQQFGQREDVHVNFVPTQSIPQCFEKLENNLSIDYSVVPLENSTNGQVVFSYDLLRDLMHASTERKSNQIITPLEVVGEQYVSIAHCLISASRLPKEIDPLSEYKTIKIYSHPQVWGQVNEYLTHLKEICQGTKFECIDTTSTSEAVSKIMYEKNSDTTTLEIAIASETAAHLNKAFILEHEINDKKGNTTRFLVLKRRNDEHVKTIGAPTQDRDFMDINLMTFTIKQDDPGSLVDILTVLKDHSVNMCSISSRPYSKGPKDTNWQYIFFIEYYYCQENINWETFYKDFDLKCEAWCLWGTFPRNERYYK